MVAGRPVYRHQIFLNGAAVIHGGLHARIDRPAVNDRCAATAVAAVATATADAAAAQGPCGADCATVNRHCAAVTAGVDTAAAADAHRRRCSRHCRRWR